MKRYSGRNEGILMLKDFVCKAIPFPPKPKKDAKVRLKQEPRKAKNGRPQRRNKKEGK